MVKTEPIIENRAEEFRVRFEGLMDKFQFLNSKEAQLLLEETMKWLREGDVPNIKAALEPLFTERRVANGLQTKRF